MKQLYFLLFCLAFTACQPPVTETTVNPFNSGKWIDLTHTFDENTIYWPTAEKFSLDTVSEGETENGYYYSAFQFCAAEHGGTHLDAPVHFARGAWAVEEIPIEKLVGEVVVLDVSEKALPDPDYQASVEDLQAWEQANGIIPDNAILLLRTGYGKYWPDKKQYMGTDEVGAEAVAKLHFPALHPDAADWLVKNRKIKAFGLDTPSIDYGQSKLFETHQTFFKNNIPAFENVANLSELPIKGSYLMALPMKIKGGSGGPLRIIAWVPAG